MHRRDVLRLWRTSDLFVPQGPTYWSDCAEQYAIGDRVHCWSKPFAKFVIANSAGAVAWALLYGLGGYYFGKGVEEFARPFAIALALVGAIVVASMIVYWRRKEQELAAAAERDIPGPLQTEPSREAGG